MKATLNRVVLGAALLLFAAAILLSQTETGIITGKVLDPSGAAVPKATVTAKSPTTGVTRTVQTSDDGIYSITDLLPSAYDVSATASGFSKSEKRVTVNVGSRVAEDFQLEVGTSASVIEVTASAAQVDTETQTLSTVVTENQMKELPNLWRNPYQFVALAGNVSDGGTGTRGAGFAINGQRESSTNVLLDGASNNDEFAGNVGQQIPLDAIQEFSVLTSNFTAEFGRASGGIVNVVSKSGTNDFHGTVYEFNRVSALSSNSFQNNANGVPEATFVRNQFGYSFGGPIKKNKLFFFSSTEWTRIRSAATVTAWIPDNALIALTPSNTQNFFTTLGQLRSSAAQIGTANLAQLGLGSGCAACASIPSTTPLFDHVTYKTPFDAGGGTPQNTYDLFDRMDYVISDKTQLYARYALYSEVDQTGGLSNSPYNNYDLGQIYYNHNALLSLVHIFSPSWTSQSKVVFNRLTNLQQGLTSRGVVPTMYASSTGVPTIGPDNVVFPGYSSTTPGNGGAFGGPQNIFQLYEDMSWVHGKHNFRFGGTYENLRDNRTYAAYQTAVDALQSGGPNLAKALQGLLTGQFAIIKAAVDPQGHFPCVGGVATPDCSVTLPVGPPNFSRSNRYNDWALYAQDSWKVSSHVTINLGLRWEVFGVQHNENTKLDSNWYAPGIGLADSNLGAYIRTGGLQVAPTTSVGGLWRPDYHNFGPRVGFAWDVFGDGKTALRAGYGIGYERNFGNVTFNLIQNPPNYAVLTVAGPITTDNFGPLAGSGGTLKLPKVGARIVDPNIKTAYAHMWNVSIERQISNNVIYSLEYSGSKGVNLYAISYPNQPGFGNQILGDPCTGNGDCTSYPNKTYAANVGYRGNEGFSIYHALNNKIVFRNAWHSGVDLTANYTWSHSIDNLSSTFFEAAGVTNQYGTASDITTNNGNYVLGLLDPFHPNLDRGNSDFDLRHRVTMAATWRVPAGNIKSGLLGRVLNGWSLNPVFVAHSGQPFSVFNSSLPIPLAEQTERAGFFGSVPNSPGNLVATGTPDSYHLITFNPAQIDNTNYNTFTPGGKWPSDMSGRNAFTGPGWWDLDLGIYKDTRITERFSLQIRGEAFNLFNHANLYAVGGSADVGAQSYVTGCYGCTTSYYDRRNLQLAAKLIF